MRSFISPFSPRVPRVAVWLALVALAAWGAGSFYTLRLNPEVRLYTAAARLEQAWARQLAAEPAPRLFVAGGSSCHTSIDPARLLREKNLRVVNMGLTAGLGVKFLTAWGLRECRPGDTLILALEPDLLTAPFTDPSLALQLSSALDAPELLTPPWLDAPAASNWRSALALRPGAYHAFTLLGKVLHGRPLYRYQLADVKEAGWLQITLHRDIPSQKPRTANLSKDAHGMLAWLRDWSEKNRIRLAYSMPWAYVADSDTSALRAQNRNFLLQVAAYIPVLKDAKLGVHNVHRDFADTALHLTPAAAALRMDSLCDQVAQWSVWAPAELGFVAAQVPTPTP